MPPTPRLAPFGTAVTIILLALGACAGGPGDEELERAGTGATTDVLTQADTALTADSAIRADPVAPEVDTARVAEARTPVPRADTASPKVTAPVPSPAPKPVPRVARKDTTRTPPATSRAVAEPAQARTVAPSESAKAVAVAKPPVVAPAPAQPAPAARRAAEAPPSATPRRPLPFAAGERLEYDVRYGPFRVGRAVLELKPVEQLRDRPVFHALFTLRGGNSLIRVDDSYQSWFDTLTLASLRYVQDIDQGPYERDRHWDIFPERQVLQERGKGEEPSVALPLDDASFIYFVRTLDLEPGRLYEFNRYFRPDRNPVKVHVLRRERIKVPAGTFDAVVVRPIIKSKGIFGEGGHAEVWFADDQTRRVLQIKSRIGVGTVSMQLR